MEKEKDRATGNTYNDSGVTILVMTTQSRRRNLDGTGKVRVERVEKRLGIGGTQGKRKRKA